jgi:hypothetical protein
LRWRMPEHAPVRQDPPAEDLEYHYWCKK